MLHMKGGESVNEYFGRTLIIANKMRIHGEKIEDVIIIEKILRSMTPKYDYVVCSSEESNDFDSLSIDELQSNILVHGQRISRHTVDEQALQVTHRIGGGRSAYRGRGRGKGDVAGTNPSNMLASGSPPREARTRRTPGWMRDYVSGEGLSEEDDVDVNLAHLALFTDADLISYEDAVENSSRRSYTCETCHGSASKRSSSRSASHSARSLTPRAMSALITTRLSSNLACTGDVPGNVLLVTIEGVEAGDVSIDVIHLVFSAFGFVHKIATFEKAAGFQALIQFSDAETASSAREALDGRSIPRYLLPDHVGSCHLRISYSAHTDLNIKFQSHRSRDYTNPYLPVNPTAIEGVVQPVVGPDGKKKEQENNVLLASIENMQYAVTVDVLNTVFSAFGSVQKIAIFEKNGGTQALIQYPDVTTAAIAKDALEGHCIYDGGYCKLHLSYSRHTDLNVKAYSDKTTVWHHPQAPPIFPGSGFATGGAMQAQASVGQVPSWDPTMQAGRPTFVSVPSTFPPGQTYASSSVPAYAIPAGSSSHMQTSQINPGVPSMRVAHPAHQPYARPGGASPTGQPPYYR
ncbi:hypothetical protein F0562_005091 [Nyssa sinensis]|uniref:RRM domain-containing protein n=1 Tax=Nyssa sinensis TaxID=561372 RepID=A0A5J5AKR6_9ASTE|nr:hypothetical protein F0562_005091 [Nyssa sinensis]